MSILLVQRLHDRVAYRDDVYDAQLISSHENDERIIPFQRLISLLFVDNTFVSAPNWAVSATQIHFHLSFPKSDCPFVFVMTESLARAHGFKERGNTFFKEGNFGEQVVSYPASRILSSTMFIEQQSFIRMYVSHSQFDSLFNGVLGRGSFSKRSYLSVKS